ncbi:MULTISPECIES: acetolactate synthase 2 small subunit [Pseudoalteromonas]|uniref:Acetolactate synthase isozyme II, small regulatory subunit n=2 Tax=Pseudoalteromonas TaxID=53246 RepID=V4I3P9_PSEL2|nr:MULTISPECIES: acetolactate synthase 2 small subunit [Pseudoalteromonas]ESP94839.1 acetolactate synthase isozyme II, small regulatory subunit [Pseudoalteromonas luteoviolacea 2ta16]KZN42793.1 acetolactate synthase [Pseudoalteromonas luteoviolacea NCIMB 1944]MBQ4839429.1 acetolactate synthase 2 small subunit [Pseudoalteromonas luteoviolacea]MCG7549689.1 acetolactate synthase 2 small subunit [Pseudoalteromonas sp. Of7M-16]MDK2597131.1 acetolactate synthase 2 small subunit [Pseudoalteromonas sp
MKHQLTVAVKNQSVAVERFLRVARHRGFRLMQLQLEGQDELFLVKMTVDSEKPIYLLTSQLNKLVDVQSVDLHTLQQQAI